MLAATARNDHTRLCLHYSQELMGMMVALLMVVRDNMDHEQSWNYTCTHPHVGYALELRGSISCGRYYTGKPIIV